MKNELHWRKKIKGASGSHCKHASAVILHKWHFLNHVVPDAFDLKFSSAADFSCFNYLYHS